MSLPHGVITTSMTTFARGASKTRAGRFQNTKRKRDPLTYRRQRENEMIKIQQSKTADTRTCDYSTVSKDQLLASSVQHIGDVLKGMQFFQQMLYEAAERHDFDKLTEIDHFHDDFITGFKQTGWWDNHRKVNRHHLMMDDGVPDDVNLVDVIDMIVDCVMAGMARSGDVYPLRIKTGILEKAFDNTVELLKSNVVVED